MKKMKTHLNFLNFGSVISDHEFGPLCFVASSRSRPSPNPRPIGGALRCRILRQTLGARQQLICMVFAQLTWREELRRGATCLNAKPEALYHLGFREPVAKSNRRWPMPTSNGTGDCGRTWPKMGQARTLCTGQALGLELESTVYALDSHDHRSFAYATLLGLFSSHQGGHQNAYATGFARSGLPPAFASPTPFRQHGVRWLDELVFEPGAFYVMDRGYMDFKRLNLIACAGAFFVTRAKRHLRFSRQRSRPVKAASGIRSDQIGKPTLAKARTAFPAPLRKVHYFDAETGRDLVFLTNHLEIPALTVASDLPSALAHRVVLPLDQRPPAHQALLRHQPQRREDSNLDFHHRLPDGRHPAQTVEPARNIAQNIATFEHSSF